MRRVVVCVTGGWVVTRQGEFCVPKVARRAVRAKDHACGQSRTLLARGWTESNPVLSEGTESGSVSPGRRPTGEPSIRCGASLFLLSTYLTPRPSGRRPELKEVSGMDDSYSIAFIGTEKREGKSNPIFFSMSRRVGGGCSSRNEGAASGRIGLE